MTTRTDARIRLKLWNKEGKLVGSTFSRRRAVILYKIRTTKWQNGYLKVFYAGNAFNDGEYDNLQDMEWALRSFTEKELVDSLNRTFGSMVASGT